MSLTCRGRSEGVEAMRLSRVHRLLDKQDLQETTRSDKPWMASVGSEALWKLNSSNGSLLTRCGHHNG